jgi:hypothetical protein
LEPVRILSDLCLCRHRKEDHKPYCLVVEYGRDCGCADFTPDDGDDSCWFTNDEAVEDWRSRVV